MPHIAGSRLPGPVLIRKGHRPGGGDGELLPVPSDDEVCIGDACSATELSSFPRLDSCPLASLVARPGDRAGAAILGLECALLGGAAAGWPATLALLLWLVTLTLWRD